MIRASFLRLERDGGVARIVLGRPAAGNAMTLQFCRELQSAAEACAADAGVRTVLLTAEGSAFCVGGDLVEFREQGEGRPAHLAKVADAFHAAQARLMTAAKAADNSAVRSPREP